MTSIPAIIELIHKSTNIMVLTGAGMSAESGLPTFRGKDGYWIKGGKNYHPMELATYRSFSQIPEVVWEWYHYRRSVYSKALPNKGHIALVDLENYSQKANKKFTLVTQNVDNLHQKAGSKNLFEVHGNIFFMRCNENCNNDLFPIPEELDSGIPACPACGSHARPHVLWFDEFYDEQFFNFQTTSGLSYDIDLLFVIGTTLQTNLPANIFQVAYSRKIPIIEINPEPIGLSDYGVNVFEGLVGEIFPQIVERLKN